MAIVKRAFPGGPWDFETRITRLFDEALPELKPDFIQVSSDATNDYCSTSLQLTLDERRNLGLFVDVQPRHQVPTVQRCDSAGRSQNVPTETQRARQLCTRQVPGCQASMDRSSLGESH